MTKNQIELMDGLRLQLCASSHTYLSSLKHLTENLYKHVQSKCNIQMSSTKLLL